MEEEEEEEEDVTWNLMLCVCGGGVAQILSSPVLLSMCFTPPHTHSYSRGPGDIFSICGRELKLN